MNGTKAHSQPHQGATGLRANPMLAPTSTIITSTPVDSRNATSMANSRDGAIG